MEVVDAIVIGAGPSGLAAASALRSASNLQARVLEFGRPLRERVRDVAEDVASGVGGAGLFSDGKFSFFPSATQLWQLRPRAPLVAAYHWYRAILAEFPWALEVPDFPKHAATHPIGSGNTVVDKSYPSHYTTLAQRIRLTESLTEPLGDALVTNVDVDEIGFDDPDRAMVVTRDRDSGRIVEYRARALVICSGRLSPLGLFQMLPDSPWTAGRLEVGVRLEQPTEEFILASHPSVDPKLIARHADGASARTFCCCRDGEIVVTDSRGIITVAGRSDVIPTGYSNVGIVLRPSRRMLVEDPSLLDRVTDAGRHLACHVTDFLGDSNTEGLVAVLGVEVASRIRASIRDVCGAVGLEVPTTGTVHGVAVEGVGNYPDLGGDLRWGSRPTWVSGDATGLFRGITAAFVSGFFAGERAREHLTTQAGG